MSTPFESLMQELAASHGMVADAAPLGLEFSCEGLTVLLLPHPLHPERLLAEVEMAPLTAPLTVPLLSLVLQVNELARFEHDWQIVMDAEQHFSLSRSAALPGLTLAELEALLQDGLDRAQSLQALLQSAAEGNPGDDEETGAEAPLLAGGLAPAFMVRV